MNGSGEEPKDVPCLNKKSLRLSKAAWFSSFFVNWQRGPEPTAMLVMVLERRCESSICN